ncbi:NADH-ubiquinone oxidoreductase [Cutibacterium acnes JCM 18918]|nr:NADH-ubiquinone oxidoreductase [Cutibacterium acnes JCM 18918]
MAELVPDFSDGLTVVDRGRSPSSSVLRSSSNSSRFFETMTPCGSKAVHR